MLYRARAVALTEHDYLVSACKFSKGMKEVLVEETVMEAFREKIPPLMDIEVLMSCHNKLVKPTPEPGQEGITTVIKFSTSDNSFHVL